MDNQGNRGKNENSLKNLKSYTTSEAGRLAGKKGGKASAEAKRKKKALKECLKNMFFGEMPKNYHLVFLDGNENNYDIQNLYCVSQETHRLMRRNKWYSNNKNVTLSAIKLCELTNLTQKGKDADQRIEFVKNEFRKEVAFLKEKYSFLEVHFPLFFKAMDEMTGGNHEQK